VPGQAGSQSKDLLGSRIQAQHARARIEHDDAGVHLFVYCQARSGQRVEDAKAEQDDSVHCPDQEGAADSRIERDRRVRGEDIEGKGAAARGLGHQHQGHGPAMLRGVREQPEEGSRIDQEQANPVGEENHAQAGGGPFDPSAGSDLCRPEHLSAGDDDRQQEDEGRGPDKGQVAAGQPAAARGVVEDKAGGGRDAEQDECGPEAVPGDLHGR